MSKKQIQKSGDRSQQVQVTIENIGIDEKRVREIYYELYEIARRDFTNEAYAVATQRVTEFENDLIPKIQKIDGTMNVFADPGFQFLLTEAHKTAAATERSADYSLLSELLIHRIQKGDNRKIRAGISRAVKIVDEISDEALLALTVASALSYYPKTGSICEGLNVLDNLYSKLCYDVLPSNNEWLEHLDIIDAIRINSFGKLKKLEAYYYDHLNGYCLIGIKQDSENYLKAIEMLKQSLLPQTLLIEHELNEKYVRLPIAREQGIDDIRLIQMVNTNGVKKPIKKTLTEDQKRVLHKIYTMYDNDKKLKEELKTRFCDELIMRPYLSKVREWWNNITSPFRLTAVGKALAYANAKRCDESIPDLD